MSLYNSTKFIPFSLTEPSYQGNELYSVSNRQYMIVVSGERGGYDVEESTEPFEHIAYFKPKNAIEREAMKSFEIEDTIKTWHFTQLFYNGEKFNKAYSDTSDEIWVRVGESIQIAATEEDKRARAIEREREQREEEIARKRQEQQRHIQRHIDSISRSHVSFGEADSYKDVANLYMNEAFWAVNESIKRAEVTGGEDLESSREASRTFVSYYEKAVDLVRAAGDYVSTFSKEFTTIGGLENQRKYARGQISYEEYISNILGDAASDAAAAAFGAKMGGGTGAALAVVGVKNPAAVPGMSAAGAKVGSAAAVVLSRASKALARVVASNGGGDDKTRERERKTEEVKKTNNTGASSTKLKNPGRSGKQARLREIMNDDKVGSTWRGWLKQDANAMQRNRAARPGLRVPPGTQLAHKRSLEAAKGYNYQTGKAYLQDIDLHKIQHKHDNFGRLNKEITKK